MIGLEIGGGPHPQRLDFEQFDAIDWQERTGLRYTLGDARQLPYPDGRFDTVFASNILEHFPASETVTVLREWWRVLRPGGTLELVVPDSLGILRDHFAGVNTWPECEERLRGSRDYPGNEHHACFTISEWPTIMAQAGLLEEARYTLTEPSNAGGGIRSVTVKA